MDPHAPGCSVTILYSVRRDLASALGSQATEHHRLLVEKVIVSPRDIEVRLRAIGIEDLALDLLPAVPEEVAA